MNRDKDYVTAVALLTIVLVPLLFGISVLFWRGVLWLFELVFPLPIEMWQRWVLAVVVSIVVAATRAIVKRD